MNLNQIVKNITQIEIGHKNKMKLFKYCMCIIVYAISTQHAL